MVAGMPFHAQASGPLAILQFVLRGARLLGRTDRALRLADALVSGTTGETRLSLRSGLTSSQVSAEPLAERGVDLGGIDTVTPQLLRIAEKTNASAIWVEGLSNTIEVSGNSFANTELEGRLHVRFDDLLNQRHAEYAYGLLRLRPGGHFQLTLQVPDAVPGRILRIAPHVSGTEKIRFERTAIALFASKHEVTAT
jgi:hypothetical protein